MAMARIREKGKLISVFDRINRIEKDLNKVLPEIDRPRLIKALSRCRQFYEDRLYYGRRTSDPEERKQRRRMELTEIEKIVYQYLLEHDLNPSTTYRWFLSTRVPSDIQDKLAKGEMPVKLALRISANRRRIRESNEGILMMEEMVNILGGL